MNELKPIAGNHTVVLIAAEEIGVKLSGLAELLALPSGTADSAVGADLIADAGKTLSGKPVFTTGSLAVYFDRAGNIFRLNFSAGYRIKAGSSTIHLLGKENILSVF